MEGNKFPLIMVLPAEEENFSEQNIFRINKELKVKILL
jgi:hypothetical protein